MSAAVLVCNFKAFTNKYASVFLLQNFNLFPVEIIYNKIGKKKKSHSLPPSLQTPNTLKHIKRHMYSRNKNKN